MSEMSYKGQQVVFITPDTNPEIWRLRNIITYLLLENLAFKEKILREERQSKVLIFEQDNTAAFKNRFNGSHGRGGTASKIKLFKKRSIVSIK